MTEHNHENCTDPTCENHYASISGVSNPELNGEFEIKPVSQTVADVISKVIDKIQHRSFSNRHPELGKMVKCQVCGLRHRASIKCEQRFKELYMEEDLETGEKTIVYAVAMQPKGIEIRGQVSAHQPTRNQVIGAIHFKKKRLNPHPNKRNLRFVELVRSLVPDEFDEIDLEKAKKRARRILVKKLGRHGFLPPIWKQTKPEVVGV